MGMRRPTVVQRRCDPRALASEDVLSIAETGSGGTVAFTPPILHYRSKMQTCSWMHFCNSEDYSEKI